VGEEQRLGEEIAYQARGELLFLRDDVVLDYVRTIGEEIVAASGPQPFVYHFEVVDDDEINAFAAPAGYVYINTGTILHARNVSEVASVLAHEIGHVALRHIAENYDRQRNAGTLYQAGVLAASVFGYGGLANVGGGLATMAVLNSFTRSDEHEADVFAVEAMPAAGYDPNGLVTFLEVVRGVSGASPPPLFATHPATEDRIAEARELIAEQGETAGLRVTDRGRLEIIQRRIELLTRKVRPTGRQPL
jgi:predicted Zn-dependent protease